MFGGFSAGDIARVDTDLAAHFVFIGVAVYVDAQPKEKEKAEPQRKLTTSRRGKR